ncbi:vitelline membrane outer layer protein 1 homolog isoform X2 [Lingula anatina]|uniref:Vitelline membrane outer layer protein 1 homolog isoform X2 n=1 Tax=Lingula anatina TaxID=7574 RepID=A0A1S3HKS0_LINAN|nr:vitelline membrane outer layer protein 1 homolog isoform X2 [Lingula anatina]|eukprot:XP_013385604.1 vitelline membrane outer layer protein 1 homolog isoform X2 [Lingula anatina]
MTERWLRLIKGDDSALNAIALICEKHAHLFPHGGIWGSWGLAVFCSADSYVIGFRLKVEGHQGIFDDSAANDLELKCSDGAVLSSGNGGPWGSWSAWRLCNKGYFVCGLRVKFQENVRGDDDTALNSVAFECCT